MEHIYSVRCPNCGSFAVRSHFADREFASCPNNKAVQTACPSCDYLMVMCSFDGSVIEAHASSTSSITRENTNSPTPTVAV